MDKPRSPHLRLVDDDVPIPDNLSLDDVLIKPGHPNFVDPNAPEPEHKPKARKSPAAKPARPRLPRSYKPFTRVFHSWIGLFPPRSRLLLVLIYRSREGREKVQLTAAIAAEAGIPSPDKSRYARELEQLGLVRVERDGQAVLTLTALLPQPS
jgi:hypothetical protein